MHAMSAFNPSGGKGKGKGGQGGPAPPPPPGAPEASKSPGGAECQTFHNGAYQTNRVRMQHPPQKFVHPGIPGGGEQKILPGLKPGDWLCPACGEQLNFSLLVYMDP